MDFSSLTPAAQSELGSVLDDEFCYCGCPHTLGQCLRNHKSCQHAKRAASLAAAMAAGGAQSSDIIITLSKYYLSFRSPRQTFELDARMCQGPKSAPITMVEFSDFECPYCGAARPVLEKFVASHKNVRLCYAPLPLQMHAHAIPAGQAALYARDHGKFWQMHDLLFENQRHLTVETIKSLAKQIGLDPAALQKVFDSHKYVDELEKSRSVAREAGVDSTPTVFVNGRKMGLAPKAEFLEQAVQDELEWSSHGDSWAPDEM
jgi:protein-disulfide isomerase